MSTIPDPPKIGQSMSAAFISQIRQKLQPTFDGLYAAKPTAQTALPTIAKDGQTIRVKLLATATGALADVLWLLTYDAASAYWIPTGAPLVSFTAAGDTTASLTYAAPGTIQEVVLPFGGDYAVSLSADISNGSASDGALASYAAGSTVASDTWAAGGFNTGTLALTVGRPAYLHAGLAAGDKIALRIRANVGGTATIANRLLNITPLRVH